MDPPQIAALQRASALLYDAARRMHDAARRIADRHASMTYAGPAAENFGARLAAVLVAMDTARDVLGQTSSQLAQAAADPRR